MQAIGFGSPDKSVTGGRAVYDTLMNTSLGNLVLSLAGFVPGYWVAFLFIDRWGRKPIQLLGFCALTVLLLTMGMPPVFRSLHSARRLIRRCSQVLRTTG